MTVWNRQHWTWRLTAIVGLALSTVPVVSWYCFLTLKPWGQPSSYTPDWYPWTASDTRFVVKWCVGVLSLWLLMLVRRKWGWVWGGLWALLGAGVVALASTDAYQVSCLGDAYNLLSGVVGLAAVVSSQIWLAVDALASATKRSRACKGMSGELRGPVWRRARLLWLVLVGAGGVVVLACALFVSLLCLVSMRELPGPEWVANVGGGLGLVLVAGVVVLLWRELILSGRTWLWWLVLWASCLVVIVIMLPSIVVDWKRLQADFPFTLDDLEQLIGAGFFAATACLLAAAQIWVALKARKLQSGQVGLATH